MMSETHPVHAQDRSEIRAQWHAMRSEYHQLVSSIPLADLRKPTLDTKWYIVDILTHMIQSLEQIPHEISVVRKGKNYLNLPIPVIGWINFVIVKHRAASQTPQTLMAAYDRAFSAAIIAWDSVAEDEWEKGGHIFGEGYYTLTEIYLKGLHHFREHSDQIQRSL